ncbi:putative PH domain-containing protein [Fusarium oxysporum f. sp. albedinis]|nr:putative PH domain-containing protein [Fusarium oxysporum f. sp. albedinis]
MPWRRLGIVWARCGRSHTKKSKGADLGLLKAFAASASIIDTRPMIAQDKVLELMGMACTCVALVDFLPEDLMKSESRGPCRWNHVLVHLSVCWAGDADSVSCVTS